MEPNDIEFSIKRTDVYCVMRTCGRPPRVHHAQHKPVCHERLMPQTAGPSISFRNKEAQEQQTSTHRTVHIDCTRNATESAMREEPASASLNPIHRTPDDRLARSFTIGH